MSARKVTLNIQQRIVTQISAGVCSALALLKKINQIALTLTVTAEEREGVTENSAEDHDTNQCWCMLSLNFARKHYTRWL